MVVFIFLAPGPWFDAESFSIEKGMVSIATTISFSQFLPLTKAICSCLQYWGRFILPAALSGQGEPLAVSRDHPV